VALVYRGWRGVAETTGLPGPPRVCLAAHDSFGQGVSGLLASSSSSPVRVWGVLCDTSGHAVVTRRWSLDFVLQGASACTGGTDRDGHWCFWSRPGVSGVCGLRPSGVVSLGLWSLGGYQSHCSSVVTVFAPRSHDLSGDEGRHDCQVPTPRQLHCGGIAACLPAPESRVVHGPPRVQDRVSGLTSRALLGSECFTHYCAW